MPLTTADKIGIGQIGLSGLQGLLGGMDNYPRENAEKQYNQNRDDEFFAMLLQALNAQSGVEQDVASENLQRSLAFSNANPLGAEQGLRTKGAAGIAGLDLLQNRKLGGGQVNNAANVNTGELRNTLSPQAAEESIRQRRIATAGLNPSAAQEIDGVGSDYASRLFGDLQQNQNQRRTNAQDAYSMINDRRMQAALMNAPQVEQKKEPGFWKKLGGALIPAAGLAANFIPGVGPLASMAIAAGTGAAGGALVGGKKGAAIGAGLNTGAAYGLNQLPSQQPQKSFNNSMTSQSLPKSMMGFENRNPGLPLQATPNNMGMPNSPNMNAPGLRPSTLASPTASNQRYFGDTRSNMLPMGQPQFDFSKMIYPQSAPQGPQSAPQNAPDMGRFSDAKIGGYGAPMNHQASTEYGKVAGPAMNAAPLGASLGLAGYLGAFGAPAAAGATNVLRQLPPARTPLQLGPAPVRPGLPSGQYNMGPSSIGKPPIPLGPSSLPNETLVSQLLQAYQKHLSLGNKEYAQQTLELMQPFLKGLK